MAAVRGTAVAGVRRCSPPRTTDPPSPGLAVSTPSSRWATKVDCRQPEIRGAVARRPGPPPKPHRFPGCTPREPSSNCWTSPSSSTTTRRPSVGCPHRRSWSARRARATAVTLAKLREAPGRALYVTQSTYLAQSARALYDAHGYERDHEGEFLSLCEFLETLRVPAGHEVSSTRSKPGTTVNAPPPSRWGTSMPTRFSKNSGASSAGGERAATIYSLVVTAKINVTPARIRGQAVATAG